MCCPIIHYQRTLKKGNIATFLLVARINIWQYVSAAAKNTFIHLFAGSPPLSINGTTQCTAKGRSFIYAPKYQSSHGENTNFKEITKE